MGFIGEAYAVIHYFSYLMTIFSLYGTVFENSSAGTVIIWLLIALVSTIIAELLKSRLPTPLRILLRKIL